MVLGASIMMHYKIYGQKNDVNLDFLINEWAISSLESNKQRIVLRNKDDFFLNNDFVKTSRVLKLSKMEGNIYSASRSDFKSFGRCGNDYRNKMLSLVEEFWLLSKVKNYHFITIINKRTYTDNSFIEIKRQFLLEDLVKDKMVLTLVDEAIN